MRILKNSIVAVPIILSLCIGYPAGSLSASKGNSPAKTTKKSEDSSKSTKDSSTGGQTTSKSSSSIKKFSSSKKKSSKSVNNSKAPLSPSRKQSNLPVSTQHSRQNLEMGYCNAGLLTLVTSQKRCKIRKGTFFIKRSAAQRELIKLKIEARRKKQLERKQAELAKKKIRMQPKLDGMKIQVRQPDHLREQGTIPHKSGVEVKGGTIISNDQGKGTAAEVEQIKRPLHTPVVEVSSMMPEVISDPDERGNNEEGETRPSDESGSSTKEGTVRVIRTPAMEVIGADSGTTPETMGVEVE